MLLKQHDSDRFELVVRLSQIKTLYRTLFQSLHADPAAWEQLDEEDMLTTLQRFLQQRAAHEGVDVADHAQWDRFLGHVDAPSCEQRLARRSTYH